MVAGQLSRPNRTLQGMAESPNYRQRVVVALLVIAGTLIAHGVGYGLMQFRGDAAHGYLAPSASVLIPLGGAALAVLAVRAAKETGLASSGVRWLDLTRWMVATYLVQEIGERLVTGDLAFGRDFGVIAAGVVAQPLVAATLVALLNALAEIVGCTRGVAPSLFPPAQALVPLSVTTSRESLRPITSRHTRGPPGI
ncbi:MAG: hypothetical protein ACI8Y4_002294 [Candidatus Poriferisodalaceae bacterium]|jgi:hypothetical protein